MGMKRVGSDEATDGIADVADHDGIVIVLGDALADQTADFGSKAGLYIYMASHDSRAAEAADFVLPATTHAEQEGTFTNHVGRVQRFSPALQAPGMARPPWLVIGALVGELTEASGPRQASEGHPPGRAGHRPPR